MLSDDKVPALQLLSSQRSHVLFVLSTPKPGCGSEFLKWYQSVYREDVSCIKEVVQVRHYRQHDIDISDGEYPRIPFRYLGLYDLSLDGASAAESVIERITVLHLEQPSAAAPSTWLYYPACEKVGQVVANRNLLLTVAFANAIPGRESEFREWYATRHIRHALNIPALISGQTFERTQFQCPGVMEARFATIALYEQNGSPESIRECFASLPEEILRFPSMDMTRFSEWVYEPL